MRRSIRLRAWQKAALDMFDKAEAADFLAVATPGAGKTTFALAAARQELQSGRAKRLVVVTPTAHLKRQWAAAAAALDLHLEPDWSAAKGVVASDMHGIVTTYQQVATSTSAVQQLSTGAFTVFDELHHAGSDRAWGDSLLKAFSRAHRRLALSGTPFRSDIRAIPFVRYEGDEAIPDFEYGYGEALNDGRVVRPIYFPRTNGHMEWAAPDGSDYSASFDDPLATVLANQRLRTALSLEGQWLPEVLQAAHARLEDIRRTQPDAGGLVIAMDQDHARGIAAQISAMFGVRATVATSDDPGASDAIARFARSADHWLVAVRMVSEGVDIPRLRVGVFATTTTTELFFRQAVGRFVRWVPGVIRQRAYLFIPDDPRLRARATEIAQRRRHSLVRRGSGSDELDQDNLLRPDEGFDQTGASGKDEGQMSLFSVISAVATDAVVPLEDDLAVDEAHGAEDDPSLVLEFAALPSFGRPQLSAGDQSQVGVPRTELKAGLRDNNAQLARALARKTGLSHAQVNAELNRLVGLRKVTEATVDQLQRRLQQAQQWMSRS